MKLKQNRKSYQFNADQLAYIGETPVAANGLPVQTNLMAGAIGDSCFSNLDCNKDANEYCRADGVCDINDIPG